MTDINQVILVGRLTRDAELKYTSSGYPVLKFSVAVNKRKKLRDDYVEEGHFFNVVLWGKLGESLNQYLIKGKQIVLCGELSQQRWEKNGQLHSRVEIVAQSIQLVGGEGNKNGSGTREKPSSRGECPSDESGFEDDIPY
jgi:single-strand DNA-binding protein